MVGFQVPDVFPGDHELRVSGQGFVEQAWVRIERKTPVLLLETDKPIYKPGQEILMRVLQLGPELKPLPGEITVEIQDAKGNKIFRESSTSDDFGMTNFSMPLSSEPNLGIWKITAASGEQTTQLDVTVDEYTLPKYEVVVDVPKNWVLANEPVIGTVSAEYSFGKPVKGELEIVASRYVGEWEEFATFTTDIDGESSFELPAVDYVAGVPAAGGQGNLALDVTVREQSTGYVEHTSRLLTVAATPVKLRIIPESNTFKPQLPFSFLLVTETPDNQPLDRGVRVEIEFIGKDLATIEDYSFLTETERGKRLLRITPPKDAVALTLTARVGRPRIGFFDTEALDSAFIRASYSPSNSFIHVEQSDAGPLEVGGQARFKVHSTNDAGNIYYEVMARGRVVFSGVSRARDIAFGLTPVMAPSSRLVVYQILPNSEVAADYIPFDVAARYPMEMAVGFSRSEARPGEAVDVNVTTQGPAKVGLAAVDRSVFILAENRVNLQQVFAELERLYMQPQVELHDAWVSDRALTEGAEETFEKAGLVVMSSMEIPQGKEFEKPRPPQQERVREVAHAVVVEKVVTQEVIMEAPAAAPAPAAPQETEDLAEVQRVRQFFPETWLWANVMTDDDGRATLPAEAPDSITTWMLRGVALSKEHGLGVAEAELRVFQPFFLQVDLPYSAIRGEEFPVKVALYNYLDEPQEFFVELGESEGFELLDAATKTIMVDPSDVGGLEFNIRLTELGRVPLKVTARSRESADAVIRDLLVEPEGVRHETVDNRIVPAGEQVTFDNATPGGSIPGSARTYVTLTGSYLSQTIEGLEGLLQMPFGCGEQNMILFAPNVFVARYLEETGQTKPDVIAKAERLMVTGYQRELTYRRADGSFSAFGDSDPSGSLWLTAFVLKTFAQAEGLIFIDQEVLRSAADWILQHQRPDGSFEPVGFLHHQELLGGLQGNTALTAYVAIALQEAGATASAGAALAFLERQLDGIDDPYTMAIVAYALALGDSDHADDAQAQLIEMAIADETGLHWGAASPDSANGGYGQPQSSAAVETTGYATLALLKHGNIAAASNAARWLVSQRNAFGGYGSTQDTVVGLQGLIASASLGGPAVDMTVTLTSGEWSKTVDVNESNFDVVQILDVPVGANLELSAEGKGRVVAQVVRRFNRPEVDPEANEVFTIDVDYSADNIEVDDQIAVSVAIRFTPTESIAAGMVVLDVSVPTGFAPVAATIEALLEEHPKLKRYDVAGRKVILYIDDMAPGDSLQLAFVAVALYPVRAQPVTSQVYSYYNPDWRGETLGQSVTVTGG
ncbi:MAG: MG2 domain-containing protein [Chloroflexi bacterium]|nr:MG2 domain-containing protein [Chloroflexota bacterium]